VNGAVDDFEACPSGEQGGLVDDCAVDRQDRDLLERDDIGPERGDDPGDRFEPVQADLSPPRGREWLARTDPGADVPADDAEPAGKTRRVRWARPIGWRRQVAAPPT
jgi:hypothetical protein